MTSGTTRNKPEERTVGQAATDVKDRAQEAAGSAMEKAKDAAASMADKAKDAASSAASTVGHRAEDAVSAVGGGMKSLAGTIREKAPQEGMLGSASSGVASTLERSGRYLQEEGLSGMGEELTALIRRNPLPAVLVGIGIGFLLARATRS